MKWSKLTLLDLGRRSLDQVSTPSYLSLKNLYNLNKSRACKATRGQAIRWNWYLNIFNHRIIKKYLYNKRWCHDSTLCEIKHIYQEELIHDHTMRKNGQNKKKIRKFRKRLRYICSLKLLPVFLLLAKPPPKYIVRGWSKNTCCALLSYKLSKYCAVQWVFLSQWWIHGLWHGTLWCL